MDVDGFMDIASSAVEGLLGRPVTHVHGVSSYSYDAAFQESFDTTSLGLQVDASAVMPALYVRTRTLLDLDLRPSSGDRVTFDVHDEGRSYLIAFVRQSSPANTVLVLKERS